MKPFGYISRENRCSSRIEDHSEWPATVQIDFDKDSSVGTRKRNCCQGQSMLLCIQRRSMRGY
jgi:hypothetical protein